MSSDPLRVTPRSLVTPADLALLREAVVELPPDETATTSPWRSVADLRRHLQRAARSGALDEARPRA